MSYEVRWRGSFDNSEYQTLHDDAFGVSEGKDADWKLMAETFSLGWVTARNGEHLIGFVNVAWDGNLHAWIQDLMVAAAARNQGLGTELVQEAIRSASNAKCKWLHVDFESSLSNFYIDSCGFSRTPAGLLDLNP